MVRQSKISTLDFCFDVTDNARSPQDFAFIFHFSEGPSLDRLQAGARSARNRFPVSGSVIQKRCWTVAGDDDQITTAAVGNDRDATIVAAQFLDDLISPHRQVPIRQLLITAPNNQTRLVTRFHHTATDGLGAALWLRHQLGVAYGLEAADTQRSPFKPLPLRTPTISCWRSQYSYYQSCDQLWTSPSKRSGKRRWLTFGFPSFDLKRASREAGGFTYNDLLATCALEVFKEWNCAHSKSDFQRIGLWLPINVRQNPSSGFGNGTSRIRLYARYPPVASLFEKAREIRRQVSWCTSHGEWAIPEFPVLRKLPRWIASRFVQTYLNLPSVDMATAIFSHAESTIGKAREALENVERIECVGLMHPRQLIALNGTTHRGHTWLTFTYDSGLFELDQVRQLSQMYQEQIKVALKESTHLKSQSSQLTRLPCEVALTTR